jgi:type II secretory pathway component PulK
MLGNRRLIVLMALALAAVGIGGVLVGATGTLTASGNNSNTQTAALYELQSSFHAAATLRDPNDLDERLADMLALWAEGGTLSLGPNSFAGKGEPGTASCDLRLLQQCRAALPERVDLALTALQD